MSQEMDDQDYSLDDEGPNMCGQCWNGNFHTGEVVIKKAYPTVLGDDNGYEQITNPIEIDKYVTKSPEKIVGWECVECFAATQVTSTSYGEKEVHPLANLSDAIGVSPTWDKPKYNKTYTPKDPEQQIWDEFTEYFRL